MKRSSVHCCSIVSALALFAALAAACPSTPAARECLGNDECVPGRCVVVNQVGHCEGATAGEGKAGEGEGEGAVVGEGEGTVVIGEGEGEGAVVGAGEGEGEGEGAVDATLHFARGAFVGGERTLASAHFTLHGALTSSRRR